MARIGGRPTRKWLTAALVVIIILALTTYTDNEREKNRAATKVSQEATEFDLNYLSQIQPEIIPQAVSFDQKDIASDPVGAAIQAAHVGQGEGIDPLSTDHGTVELQEDHIQQSPEVDPPSEYRDGTVPHLPGYLAGKTLDLTNFPTKPVYLDSDLQLDTNDEYLPYFANIDSVPKLSVETAYGTCQYTEEELKTFLFDWNSEWVKHPVPDSTIEPEREAWQQFVKTGLIPWESVKDRFDGGKGIVIVGGRGKEPNRIKVLLRALLKHGSQLPVEINYFGDETSAETRKQLEELYPKISFNDLSDDNQLWRTTYRLLPNYQFKLAAMVNSRFSEILLLDSDIVPTTDPAILFESDTYKKYGSVFWPDQGRLRHQHPAWAVFNSPCRRDEYALESGQLLVDKRRRFYHLQLAAWLISRPYWEDKLLGDKDMFLFAWKALKTGFGRPAKWITSLGFVAEQPIEDGSTGTKMVYCGHSFAQAFPDHTKANDGSGIAFIHANSIKTAGAPMLARLRRKGGIYTHFKRVKVETLEDWSQVESGVGPALFSTGFYQRLTSDLKVQDLVDASEDPNLDGSSIGEAGQAALELREDDFERKMVCVDFRGVEERPIAELGDDAVNFEQLWADSGGYWPLEDAEFRGW